MSEMKRCKAKHVRHNEVVQCEGLEGHMSAHFNEDTWWANPKGLPAVTGVSNRALTWFGLIVFGALAFVIILWLAWR